MYRLNHITIFNGLSLALILFIASGAQNVDGRISNQTVCDPDVLDTCSATVFVFGKRNVYLPVNSQEMVPHCQEELDAEDCIKNYSRRCLTPFERQVTGMLMLGAGQVIRKRCTAEGTKEYLSHYKCISMAIESLHDAMEQLINSLMIISNEKNHDDKIPMSCCAFARYQEYSSQLVRGQCDKFDKGAQEYVTQKMIRGYASEVLDLACPGFEFNGDKCNRVKLPTGGFQLSGSKMVKVTETSPIKAKKAKSITLPFITIFTHCPPEREIPRPSHPGIAEHGFVSTDEAPGLLGISDSSTGSGLIFVKLDSSDICGGVMIFSVPSMVTLSGIRSSNIDNLSIEHFSSSVKGVCKSRSESVCHEYSGTSIFKFFITWCMTSSHLPLIFRVELLSFEVNSLRSTMPVVGGCMAEVGILAKA
ncbi:hypothetical protein GZH46_01691 [Fragariocoptes setiger]|uniref:Secreted protein n=1 Tax=Fragariocoptes setiger TaxID=1670756 RepID=A0ABQ7S8N1_9ACAR|nr:hypothetical protein GZH46_01691 [Fragariocoptes setiger]